MTEPFIFANGQAAHSSKDLIQLCKNFPADGIRYLLREDIEKWLAYIGDNQTAQYASEARTATVDDAKKLDSFLSNLQDVPKKAEAPKIENKSAVVKEPEAKNVAAQTEQVSQPSVAAKTSSNQEVAPKPKQNLFHWIANFFRS